MLDKTCRELTTGIRSIKDWHDFLLPVLASEEKSELENLPWLQEEIDWLCDTFIYDYVSSQRELKVESRGKMDLGERGISIGGMVNEFAFSEDGSTLALLVDKNALEFINYNTGEHSTRFLLVGLDPRSYISRFYYVGRDCLVDSYTVDPDTGNEILIRVKVNESLLSSSKDVVSDEVFAKDKDGAIYVVDRKGRTLSMMPNLREFAAPEEASFGICRKLISIEHFLVAQTDEGIFVWDTKTGQIIFNTEAYAFTFKKNEPVIIFFDESDGILECLNLEDMSEEIILKVDNLGNYDGNFSGEITFDKTEDNLLVAGAKKGNNTITVINIPRKRIISKFKTDFDEGSIISGLGYTKDGEIIVSAQGHGSQTMIYKLPGLEKYQS